MHDILTSEKYCPIVENISDAEKIPASFELGFNVDAAAQKTVPTIVHNPPAILR